MKYFRGEVCTFLTMLGSRAFWDLPMDTQQRAWAGLCFVAARIRGGKDSEIADLLKLAATEFERRSVLIAFRGEPSEPTTEEN